MGKKSYYLTVDTCYRQQQLYPDKNFDCFDEQDSFDIMTSVHIETKTGVEFFSPANYQAKNKRRSEYEFKTRRYIIAQNLIDRQSFKVEKTAISFKGNLLYHNDLLSFNLQELTTYAVLFKQDQALIKESIMYSQANYPYNSRLSIHFTQSTQQHSYSAERSTIESSFRSFGSYLALIIRFTQLLLGKFQRFSIDKSMVKKLYTCDESDDNGNNDDQGA